MKFYGNKNSVFANALVSEYVTSNDFNIEVSTGEWLSKEIEKAMPDKDDFFEEIKKASKKARNGRSFTKLERAQMKKDAAMKRAKALGVEGSVEEGRDFYNAVAKTNHYATGKGYSRLYNAECRESKRRDAEKRLMRAHKYEPDYDEYVARKYAASLDLYNATVKVADRSEAVNDKLNELAEANNKLQQLREYAQMVRLHRSNLEYELEHLQMYLDEATEEYNIAKYNYDVISIWD